MARVPQTPPGALTRARKSGIIKTAKAATNASTPPRLLRQLRHADLCLCGKESAELWLARRNDHTARRLLTAPTGLAAVGTAVGGRTCHRACGREGLRRL